MNIAEEHMWMVRNNYSCVVYWSSEKIIDKGKRANMIK